VSGSQHIRGGVYRELGTKNQQEAQCSPKPAQHVELSSRSLEKMSGSGPKLLYVRSFQFEGCGRRGFPGSAGKSSSCTQGLREGKGPFVPSVRGSEQKLGISTFSWLGGMQWLLGLGLPQIPWGDLKDSANGFSGIRFCLATSVVSSGSRTGNGSRNEGSGQEGRVKIDLITILVWLRRNSL